MYDSKTYYYSPRWLRLRREVLAFAEHKCNKCGTRNELNVHHKHYKTLGNEDISDLIVLCKRCHSDLHFEKTNKFGKDKR